MDRQTMPDHYQLDPFLTAKSAAEARREQAIRKAHEAFSRAYLFEKARHAAEYERASARWDAVKSNPCATGYNNAWRAFQDAKLPANHDAARAELDRAIRAADATYYADVAAIGSEHKVYPLRATRSTVMPQCDAQPDE
jgi:hypothetical protein